MANKIILGTAQLGMDYGINNPTGKPSETEALSILRLAHDAGIRKLDTAHSYGNSQKIIGHFAERYPNKEFHLLTKFKKSNDISLHDQVIEDLNQLKSKAIYAYSYHHFIDTFDEEMKDELTTLKDEKQIRKIGVSVYTNDEFAAAIEMPHVDIIQLPFNLLDNWNKRGHLILAAKAKEKEVHVRSIFLQGLFYKSEVDFPFKLKPLIPYINRLKEIADKAKVSVGSLALKYVLSFKEIDNVLIGIEKISQLEENLNNLAVDIAQHVFDEISSIDVDELGLIDPRKWK